MVPFDAHDRKSNARNVGNLSSATEDELIDGCLYGDELAFGELMTRHQRLVYNVCLRITENHDDALEAMQETLIRVWRLLGGYERRSSFRTWLYRVASNAALEETRRRRRRPEPTDEVWVEGVAGVARAAQVVPVDEQVVARMTADEALSQLPPSYRAAVVLRELCGCSYDEIAAALAIPVNTVKSRIARGRQALSLSQ
ncbi:RNA polymerase sigma factor [Geodermatophilus chilensis]|uniref:RNA polymerase sigma factor n=1 Tax=Geodermatophilus chilensis TaxID=2035835 RepID=UPI001300168C|nr:RNA polymerase sigma factor [Geodermatophilus chilensis]